MGRLCVNLNQIYVNFMQLDADYPQQIGVGQSGHSHVNYPQYSAQIGVDQRCRTEIAHLNQRSFPHRILTGPYPLSPSCWRYPDVWEHTAWIPVCMGSSFPICIVHAKYNVIFLFIYI